LECKHKHQLGRKTPLLIKQSSSAGGQEIKLKAEDVLFKREQFQVKSRGAAFYVKERPKVGQIIHLRVKVECLHENSEEESKR
jgi:hypothetical protein